jgi:hypothetical protein
MDKKISEEEYLPASSFDGTEKFIIERDGSNYNTNSTDIKGITQISRANLITLRDSGLLTRGFYQITDAGVIVFAPNIHLVSKWAYAGNGDYNKFIEYDLDTDTQTWIGEFLRQPHTMTTNAAQLDYVIPEIEGWTIASVQLGNMMLIPSQYTLTGDTFTLVVDSGDVASGMHLQIIGYKS